MNFILFKHAQRPLYHQPEGLNELIADISREVLRAQPENIYDFIADYVEAMLLTREQSHIAQQAVDDALNLSTTIASLLDELNINYDEAMKTAKLIEEGFRKHVSVNTIGQKRVSERDILMELATKCNFTEMQMLTVRKILDKAFRDYFHRPSKHLPETHFNEHIQHTIDFYYNSQPERVTLNKAATVIQAAYRGHRQRRDKNMREVEDAAIRIQATYRGHLVRKQNVKE